MKPVKWQQRLKKWIVMYLNKPKRWLFFKSAGPMKCLSDPCECSLLRFILISSSLGKGRVVNNNDQTLFHKASIRMKLLSCKCKRSLSCAVIFSSAFVWRIWICVRGVEQRAWHSQQDLNQFLPSHLAVIATCCRCFHNKRCGGGRLPPPDRHNGPLYRH